MQIPRPVTLIYALLATESGLNQAAISYQYHRIGSIINIETVCLFIIIFLFFFYESTRALLAAVCLFDVSLPLFFYY